MLFSTLSSLCASLSTGEAPEAPRAAGGPEDAAGEDPSNESSLKKILNPKPPKPGLFRSQVEYRWRCPQSSECLVSGEELPEGSG